MGEIIQFATGEEVASALASANQQVSGMTPTEAWNAMNLRETGKMGAGDYLSQGGNNVIDFPNQGASDAFNSYLEGGGATSSAGAAAAGASKTFQLTSFLKAGAAKVGAILSISLPQAAAAIAPLLGVALGAAIYSAAPDFWEKVSQALLPWCWEGTENIPGIVGEDGQVYISKDAIDAVKKVFDELEIGETTEHTTYISGSKTYNLYRKRISIPVLQYDEDEPIALNLNPPYIFSLKNGKVTRFDSLGASDTVEAVVAYVDSLSNGKPAVTPYLVAPESIGKFTYDYFDPSTKRRTGGSSVSSSSVYFSNRRAYYYAGTPVVTDAIDSQIVPTSDYVPGLTGETLWWILYATFQSSAYYPDGTSEYGGNTPVDYTQNGVDVIKDSSGNTEPYYPVHIPIGDPGVTTDPSVNPNPQSPNEFPDLDPLLNPEVNPNQYPQELPVPTPAERTNPLPSPATDPQPSFDPDANPSVRPDPVPSPEPSPTYPIETPEDSPTSSGDSPPTIFPIPDQDWPAIVPTTGSGLIHVYNPTSNEMVAFGNWLWVTYADKDIDKLWNNPFDGVISAHELYATPQTDGTDSIRSGFLTCPTTAKLVRVRYTTVDCGSIVIPEFYQNYLDYAPYTKAHVYLPFVGIVELDPDDIVGHAVNIKYHIDSYNGSCIAQITVAKSDYSNTVYQFSGNCAVELPLAGGSQASIRAGMIMAAASGLTSVVGGIASAAAGSVGGAVGSLVSGAGSVAGHLVSQKSSVQHSGSFGASFGAMGIKKPYIIIRRPIQKEVTNYNIEYGFPAHKKVTIGSCTGYLRVLEVHVKSPTATDEEKRAIEEALKNGIFVT